MTTTSSAAALERETERIRSEYARRDREITDGAYSLSQADALFRHQYTVRALRNLLAGSNLLPLTGRRVLDVGCGRGDWLAVFEQFGAQHRDLAGIDLDAARVRVARERLAGVDIRCGNAATLPWSDGAFDVVFQSTVFTSILDAKVRQGVAQELIRVLKPGGVIVWYDFTYNNPRNPNVAGIPAREVLALFPGMHGRFARVTLAPPIARWLVRRSWTAARLLQSIKVLNTHILGSIRR